jgi:pimeloyl-ACP methyl ester carboxylesterase
LILHGTEDKEIEPYHAKTLLARSNVNCKLKWIEGAGHNNIDENFRKEFLECLQEFVFDLKLEK